MEKNYIILKKYILYFIVFALVCIVGISNCFALTNNNSINFYDNNGSSLTSVSTNYIQQIDESSAIFTTTANSYGGAVMIQTSTPLIQNHIYTLFINVGAESNGGFTVLSTKNCIGLGNNYNNTINSYVNCSIIPKYSQPSGVTSDKGKGIYFTFIANTNGNYILIPYTTQLTCYNCRQYSYGFNLDDGGDTTGLTQQQVNNLITNQTTVIQNEINQMQQDISGSIDNMTDEIIDSNLTCYNGKHEMYSRLKKQYISNTSGETASNNFYSVSQYFYIEPEKNYRVDFNNITGLEYGYLCWYKDNTLLSCTQYRNMSGYSATNFVITSPSTANKVTLTFRNNSNATISTIRDLSNKLCENKQDKTNQSIDDINSNLTDTTPVDASSLGNTAGWLPPGPIDSIINLPQTFLLSLTSALGGTCVPLDITIPYVNQHINIPCLSTIFSQINGLTTFWVWVGRIASVVILYRYLIALWDYYDRLTTMQANFRDDFGGGV